MKYSYHVDGTSDSTKIFVFGSNLAGVHGAGAARHAYHNLNAEWGVGEGLTGSSYAIPTKDHNIQTLPLLDIQDAVNRFILFAIENPELQFFVTRVGCVLAGHSDEDIAQMFLGAPTNCDFPETWAPILEG